MCRFLEGVRAAVPLIAGSISWAPISWPREVPRLTELLELVRTSEEDGSCTPSVPCRSDQSETQADRDGYDGDGDAEHEGRSRTSVTGLAHGRRLVWYAQIGIEETHVLNKGPIARASARPATATEAPTTTNGRRTIWRA